MFPYIDFSHLVDDTEGAVNGLEAGGTSGVLPGLNQALLQHLANYRPGDIGICELDPKLQITLPMTGWEWYGWGDQADVSIPAGDGQNEPALLFTVPMGERAWLDNIHIERASGDNQLIMLEVIYGPGYRSGTGLSRLLSLSPANNNIYWPDPTGAQALALASGMEPILMEEGTIVQVKPSGAGVAISVYNVQLRLRRTPVGRVRAP